MFLGTIDRVRGAGAIGLVVVALAACGPALSDQDRIATRVAEDRAVAATLTVVARAAQPPEVPTRILEADTPTPMPMPTPSAVVVTRQVVPIVPPTQEIATAVPPSITPRPTLEPIVPAFGDTNDLQGQVVLPGYGGSVDDIVFTEAIVFRLMVRDPNFGDADGAGIVEVEVTIDDQLGNTVHRQVERTSWYCAFGGGAPQCPVWRFAEHDNAWSSGVPVCRGAGYQANMIVRTQDSNQDGASWRFNFAIAGEYPEC